ncbi:hypothetical protein JHK82_036337 [Glycine max]|nr:hypothetical protein JHK85_037066 [Glycine max]KAG4977048.1 hypothetical protein JHK86_036522 [Glycine max]KAG5113068.1 hypothetical protein JHK82_036337 [Glycine max]KAG5130347.1 hypothetical protein JHK84_036744 [Glycine max]
MSVVLATCFFVHRHCIRRERPRAPLVREFHGMSSRLVKAMPSLIFTVVLEDNCTSRTCAICLEDYCVGEKLRIPPCCHMLKSRVNFLPGNLRKNFLDYSSKLDFNQGVLYYGMGVSENSWMTLMDRLLTLNNYCTNENEKERVKENMLKLIDIYYEALDAPKSGRNVSLYYSLVATYPTSLVGTQKTNILL